MLLEKEPQFRVIIPARYASTRLPGKPLVELGGKPMIQHVYQKAYASQAKSIVVATDDQRIADCAAAFGAQVCLTSVNHQSGTERIAEVIEKMGYEDDEIVVNLQGDEPFIPPAIIRQVAEDLFAYPDASVASLYKKTDKLSDIFNPNVVKVILDQQGYALYFSRAPIPWEQKKFSFALSEGGTTIIPYNQHIGIYAYRAGFIKDYIQLPSSDLERIESLEQLRILWHGHRIHLALAQEEPALDINTPEDLVRARELLNYSGLSL